MNFKYNIVTYFITAITIMSCEAQTYDEKLESLYNHTVDLIRVEDLKDWQNSKKDFYLLDIRSVEEYQVSHIKQAKFIDYDRFSKKDVTQLDKDKPVVLYCSVGYRSEKIGEKMKKLGFEKVYNLYGGIFQWKNLDQSVVNANGSETDSVHTYDKNWGKWLKKGVKIY